MPTVLPEGDRGPEEGRGRQFLLCDRNSQMGRSDSWLCRHHHAAQKAPVRGTVCGREAEGSAGHSLPARSPRGAPRLAGHLGEAHVRCQLLFCPTGPAYTCVEAASGRALVRQHVDVAGEDHPLSI